MPCFFPEGAPQDWCERHKREAAGLPGGARASA